MRFALHSPPAAVPLRAMLLALSAFSCMLAAASPASTAGGAQPAAAPDVRAIGLLRSADPRQSRAILRVNGGAPADYAEGDALAGGWSVKRIRDASVAISDGARVVQVPVTGGKPQPAVPQPAVGPIQPVPTAAAAAPLLPAPAAAAAPQVPPHPTAEVLRDAARRRAIHNQRAE